MKWVLLYYSTLFWQIQNRKVLQLRLILLEYFMVSCHDGLFYLNVNNLKILLIIMLFYELHFQAKIYHLLKFRIVHLMQTNLFKLYFYLNIIFTSVTTPKSFAVSKWSNIKIIFSCFNLFKISISYLKLLISFSDFPLLLF